MAGHKKRRLLVLWEGVGRDQLPWRVVVMTVVAAMAAYAGEKVGQQQAIDTHEGTDRPPAFGIYRQARECEHEPGQKSDKRRDETRHQVRQHGLATFSAQLHCSNSLDSGVALLASNNIAIHQGLH